MLGLPQGARTGGSVRGGGGGTLGTLGALGTLGTLGTLGIAGMRLATGGMLGAVGMVRFNGCGAASIIPHVEVSHSNLT